jgi:uncharacterized membrane protein
MKTKEKIIWSLIGFVAGIVVSSIYWNCLIGDIMDGMFGK